MISYEPPVDDARFLLQAFDYPRIASLDAFRAYDLETVALVLEQFGEFFRAVVAPTNSIGDRKGCDFDSDTHRVTTPSQFRKTWRQLAQKGYHGTVLPPRYGGSGGPYVLGTLLDELFMAANKSLAMFGELSSGLARTLVEKGSEPQKNRYIPKLADGTCAATMAMTEPQCGSDVSLIRTRAEPVDGDDRFSLTGSKRWITGGEHDLTDNILHLVLAKRPNPESAPGNGLAAFLVPKNLPDGTRNSVTCTGLEDKMGIHGSPTCELHFDEADGWLIGELDDGMSTMFVMMGEIRRKVGLEGIALSEIAYQVARDWAQQRRQGRSLDPDKRDEAHNADPILVHPDVRRMLAEIKASTEGMRGFAVWMALQADVARHHPRAEVRNDAQNLVDLITPIFKAYCSERGFANVNTALQITGGAGYTKDLPVEQYLRDLRIASVYEGTNYIQAL
ncbi:MAG: acyl-CoA dehydrogenase family protein, partial [Bradymonadaceae bacterium]